MLLPELLRLDLLLLEPLLDLLLLELLLDLLLLGLLVVVVAAEDDDVVLASRLLVEELDFALGSRTGSGTGSGLGLGSDLGSGLDSGSGSGSAAITRSDDSASPASPASPSTAVNAKPGSLTSGGFIPEVVDTTAAADSVWGSELEAWTMDPWL